MPSNHYQIRNTAVDRGLDFIGSYVAKPKNFERYGTLIICCFALVAATSRNRKHQRKAKAFAIQLAQRWRSRHRFLPTNGSPDLLLESLIVCYALERIRKSNRLLRSQIATAVKKFSAKDLLGFDPACEPPPADLPYVCDCGNTNERGRKFCKHCRRRLFIQTHYRVWMEALASTFMGERCGITYGAPFAEVLKWLPAMRPYPPRKNSDEQELAEALYAVTHLVYTLNDYNTRKLSARSLKQEYEFLQANVDAVRKQNDVELLGELIDSLKALGLPASDPLIQRGESHLLENQNKDGSWGDPEVTDAHTRGHTTWTVIDALRTYNWRGAPARMPALKRIAKVKIRGG